ncbi:MAG: VWA-like domain-containing protein [Acidobacteria bacterium]|jgi:predicted metal-dependent peptidase|nr:VWA-like domain-containing protein [Acidobacteriota bacterium]
MKPVRERITKTVEKWYILEPLFFSAWSLHTVIPSAHVKTIRSGAGKVEYNPDFLSSLTDSQLYEILCFEAMRIVLKHPYTRKKEIDSLSYRASNITVQEYLKTSLGFEYARDVFGTDAFDRKHFEFYYDKLIEQIQNSGSSTTGEEQKNGGTPTGGDQEADNTQKADNAGSDGSDGNNGHPPQLEDYIDSESGVENCENWEKNDYYENLINEKISEAESTNSWGSLSRNVKEKILATLKPKVDYRSILKSFRASILSVSRRLSRMKPSRRYDFQYMGSKRDFTTKILFAVDVSGSISSKDLAKGFSIVNRFFKYGIEQLDVISFDTEIKGEKLSLKKARREIKVLGRGGTNFQPLMDYIDRYREYDGLIIFTDGYAPVPRIPQNRKTRIVWLFNNEGNYEQMKNRLIKLGKVAFVKGK